MSLARSKVQDEAAAAAAISRRAPAPGPGAWAISKTGQGGRVPLSMQRQLSPAADKPWYPPGAAQEAIYAVQQNTSLFDHLVGAGEQRRRA